MSFDVKMWCAFIKLHCISELREKDSNLRPLGYEPSELPLLYPAYLVILYNISIFILFLAPTVNAKVVTGQQTALKEVKAVLNEYVKYENEQMHCFICLFGIAP